jgi:undecaprenyl pyrophosphate phosphatase UppP
MVTAFYHARLRKFHVPVMITIMVCDLFFPVYLVMTRDWYQRLILDEDILTFGIWMHLGAVISLFVLYGVQIQAGRGLLNDSDDTRYRQDHRSQAKAILAVRALVIFTGALLVQTVEPETSEQAG